MVFFISLNKNYLRANGFFRRTCRNPQRSHMKFFSLFFEKMPVVKDSHVITVEVTTDDGRVLSGSIVMDFAE